MKVLGAVLIATQRPFRSLDDDRLYMLRIVWESCCSRRVEFDLATDGLVYLEDVVTIVRLALEDLWIDGAHYEASRSVFPVWITTSEDVHKARGQTCAHTECNNEGENFDLRRSQRHEAGTNLI